MSKKDSKVSNITVTEPDAIEAIQQMAERELSAQIAPSPDPVRESTPVPQEDDSINAGLIVSLADHRKVEDERKAKYRKEKAMREAMPGGKKLSHLIVQADTPYGMQFLHRYAYGIQLAVHSFLGEGRINEICQIHYGINCKICGQPTQKGEAYAVDTLCLVSYVFNLVGATFDKTNEKTGEVTVFNKNPTKVLRLPMGKNNANLNSLEEADRRNYFMSDIWIVERQTGSGFKAPYTRTSEEFFAMAGKRFPLELPDSAKKIASLSKKDILRLILSTFDNVDWERLGFKAPLAQEVPVQAIEVKTSASDLLR